MIYILETNLPKDKPIHIALSQIHGIGKTKSINICKSLGFCKNLKLKNLKEKHFLKIIRIVESKNWLIASELKQTIKLNNEKLVSIKSYKGLRKIRGLPIRGQRTHTNARSARISKKKPNVQRKPMKRK